MIIPRPGGYSIDEMMSPNEYLARGRVLNLCGEIVPAQYVTQAPYNFITSVSYVAESLMILDTLSHAPIYLFLESPGGLVEAGLQLYDVIKSIKSPVYTISRGCQSLAVVLLSSGERGHRYVFPHSRTMLHLPAGEFSGPSDLFEIRNQEIQKTKNLLVSLLIDNGAKRSKDKILYDIGREFWMDAQETIEYGLADQLFTAEVWKKISKSFLPLRNWVRTAVFGKTVLLEELVQEAKVEQSLLETVKEEKLCDSV